MGSIADLRLAEERVRIAVKNATAAQLELTLARLALAELRRIPTGAQ
jgi:hypothetical protein